MSKSSESISELTKEEQEPTMKGKASAVNEMEEKPEDKRIKLIIPDIRTRKGTITVFKDDFEAGMEEMIFKDLKVEDFVGGEGGGCSAGGGNDDDDDKDINGFKCLKCGKIYDDFAKLQCHLAACW